MLVPRAITLTLAPIARGSAAGASWMNACVCRRISWISLLPILLASCSAETGGVVGGSDKQRSSRPPWARQAPAEPPAAWVRAGGREVHLRPIGFDWYSAASDVWRAKTPDATTLDASSRITSAESYEVGFDTSTWPGRFEVRRFDRHPSDGVDPIEILMCRATASGVRANCHMREAHGTTLISFPTPGTRRTAVDGRRWMVIWASWNLTGDAMRAGGGENFAVWAVSTCAGKLACR